jgi:hypothetical protein
MPPLIIVNAPNYRSQVAPQQSLLPFIWQIKNRTILLEKTNHF